MAVRNNPFKPIIKKIPAPLRNKYFLVLVCFTCWMIFFDKHDVFTNLELNRKVQQMEHDRDYYLKQIEEVKQDRTDLQNNIEKFAREHYFMKKSDEDVFIIEEESESILDQQ